MNLSLLVKWWWRFKTKDGNLWKRVISAIHYQSSTWSFLPVKAGLSGPWNAIFKIGNELSNRNMLVKKHIKGIIGDGNRFWVDNWVADGPLMDRFPTLFALEAEKGVTVANRFTSLGWLGEWRRNPATGSEISELLALSDELMGMTLNGGPDKWVWEVDPSGLFTVQSCKRILNAYTVPYFPFNWCNWVPKKINVFGWQAEQERLPTLVALHKRKILHGSTTCRLCGECDETIVTGNAKRPLYRVPDSLYQIEVQSRPNRLWCAYRIANLDRSRLCTIIAFQMVNTRF
ncbi:putative reverse transcriptase zinc-binding domain-containing protein [Helianthus annuus]|nr:putative reverse transcriptase zinc-binding domain-containing protein [Helianthus annuus]